MYLNMTFKLVAAFDLKLRQSQHELEKAARSFIYIRCSPGNAICWVAASNVIHDMHGELQHFEWVVYAEYKCILRKDWRACYSSKS